MPWDNFIGMHFNAIGENLHTIDISRTPYRPRLGNVVCERPQTRPAMERSRVNDKESAGDQRIYHVPNPDSEKGGHFFTLHFLAA